MPPSQAPVNQRIDSPVAAIIGAEDLGHQFVLGQTCFFEHVGDKNVQPLKRLYASVELDAMRRVHVSCALSRVVLRHGTWLPDEVAGAELNFLSTDDCDS